MEEVLLDCPLDELLDEGRFGAVAASEHSVRSATEPLDLADKMSVVRWATAALGDVEPGKVEVFRLRYVEDLTYREIGERIGRSKERVRSILCEVEAVLRRSYVEDESPSGKEERWKRRCEFLAAQQERREEAEARRVEEYRTRAQEVSRRIRRELYRKGIGNEDGEAAMMQDANRALERVIKQIEACGEMLRGINADGPEDTADIIGFFADLRSARERIENLVNRNEGRIDEIVDSKIESVDQEMLG